MLLACGAWTLLRTDGVTGAASSQLTWRWTRTAEERLLAQAEREPAPVAPATTATASPASAPVWRQRRRQRHRRGPPQGARGDSLSRAAGSGCDRADSGVGLTPRAAAATPARLDGWVRMGRLPWRDARRHRAQRQARDRLVGEATRRAVASAHRAGLVVVRRARRSALTQEQRGEEEIVSCYRVSTGEPVWRHRDRVRFWESNGGAGPRGTPTLQTAASTRSAPPAS